MWGALGEPGGGFGVVAQSSFFQSWGEGGRGILALRLAGGRSVKCGHLSELLEVFWGL